MVGDMQSTTYLAGPILAFLIVYLSMFANLLNTVNNLSVKLNAYTVCSEKMMDSAFLGKVLDFKSCYLKELQNSTPNKCYISENKIVCERGSVIISYTLSKELVREAKP